jgi:hypothetical protein
MMLDIAHMLFAWAAVAATLLGIGKLSGHADGRIPRAVPSESR